MLQSVPVATLLSSALDQVNFADAMFWTEVLLPAKTVLKGLLLIVLKGLLLIAGVHSPSRGP